MKQQNDLLKVSNDVIQKIYQSLFQAVGEDYQEAESHLCFETHIAKPFLIWDLINRNLIRNFMEDDVLYSTKKRGMWEILLLFDKNSKMILSFMKDTRFEGIQKTKHRHQPQYIRALLLLNQNLQARVKQQKLFGREEIVTERDNQELKALLNSLCTNFTEPVISVVKHHALVVFSSKYGQLSSLKAYVLDSDLDIVYEQDWLNTAKPLMSNEVDTIVSSTEDKKNMQIKLTPKANQRLKQKQLVSIKTANEESEVQDD